MNRIAFKEEKNMKEVKSQSNAGYVVKQSKK
jgi:hypothetical protein